MKTTKNMEIKNIAVENKSPSKRKSSKLSNGTMNLFKTKNKKVASRGKSTSNNGTLAPLEISVVELVGDGLFAMDTHGEVAYGLIVQALKQNRPVKISYKDVEEVTPLFEKTAVGNLYKKFKAKKIEELVEIVDATDLQEQLYASTIDRYRRFLKNPRKYRKHVEAVMNGEF